jgi:hypothetical protein
LIAGILDPVIIAVNNTRSASGAGARENLVKGDPQVSKIETIRLTIVGVPFD